MYHQHSMHIGIHNQHGILPSNCICQRHLPESQFACADIKNVHLFYIISSSSRLGATDEIPNLDVWPKIALQNGRSVSFRGGLEPSDLGDSFGFPKSFIYVYMHSHICTCICVYKYEYIYICTVGLLHRMFNCS